MQRRIDMKATGNSIRRFREAREIGVSTLAKELAIEETMIAAWENGEALPDVQSAVALCLYFEMPMEYMIQLQDPEETKRLREQAHRDRADLILAYFRGDLRETLERFNMVEGFREIE